MAKELPGKVAVVAGASRGVYDFAALDAITPEHFHKTFDLNVLGLMLTTREAVEYFGEVGGGVVNVSPAVGTLALRNATVYSASKAAVAAVTRAPGAELGRRRVRVNSVNPGRIETETNAMTNPGSAFRKAVESSTPLGRIGQVDDVAPAVVVLAPDDSKWITGESLYLAGGYRR
jgi:3-oxoacyl-[acyl-carrier protein] reductase